MSIQTLLFSIALQLLVLYSSASVFAQETDRENKNVQDTTNFEQIEQVVDFDLNELGNHIVYPNAARMRLIEGMVYLKCLIGENNNLEKIIVEYADNPLLIEGAVNGVKSVKSWQSAIGKEGKPVKLWLTIPIEFRLTESEKSFIVDLLFGSEEDEVDQDEKEFYEYLAKYHVGDEISIDNKEASQPVFNETDFNKLAEIVNLDRIVKVKKKILDPLLEKFEMPKDIEKEICEVKVLIFLDKSGTALRADLIALNDLKFGEAIRQHILKHKFEPFTRKGKAQFTKLLVTIEISNEDYK